MTYGELLESLPKEEKTLLYLEIGDFFSKNKKHPKIVINNPSKNKEKETGKRK